MITIDGYNIETEWGLEPVYEGYYNALMKAPDIKDRITNDWSDEDGIEVLFEKGYQKAKEMTLKFACDTIPHYNAFMSYLIANPTVVLADTNIDTEVTVEYMSSSEFHHYSKYNMFGIKVRQISVEDVPAPAISLEIRDDMNLWFTTPEDYTGVSFTITDGDLIGITTE